MSEEKIVKNCCKFCVEQGVNCLGCAVAAGVAENARFDTFCKGCIEAGECKVDFKNMKDRNVCWVLSDEDRERYRKANPEFDAKLKEKEKKAEDDAVEKITDDDIARMERLIALKKKKQAEQEKK